MATQRRWTGCRPRSTTELHGMARRYMKNERAGNTLQTTALVNEVYLRLVDVKSVEWKQRAQFFAIAAQMMRRILVDAARARGSHKRGGGAIKVNVVQQTLTALQALVTRFNQEIDAIVLPGRPTSPGKKAVVPF